MSEENLIRHFAPTLAGIKTGSLFNLCYGSDRQMLADARHWNGLLTQKGLRMLPLRFSDGRGLIYLYRPSRLAHDLRQPEAVRILNRCGYRGKTPEQCVAGLAERMRRGDAFPHEIGLLLGYPPADVLGFMESPAACKCVGCWKVYGDVEAARETFARYEKCTQAYCRQYRAGRGVQWLAVAG